MKNLLFLGFIFLSFQFCEITLKASGGCSGVITPVVYNNEVHGCPGAFTGGLLGQQALSLCNVANGWNICASAGELLGLGLSRSVCSSNTPSGHFYASQQSSQGSFSCGPTGTNDFWGCGQGVTLEVITNCDPFTHAFAEHKQTQGWTTSGVGFTELLDAISDGNNGGVLCCHTFATGGQDPEFKTLDGISYNYDGPCSYIVSTNKCDKKEKKYPLFQVLSHHGRSQDRNSHVIIIKQMSILIWPDKLQKEILIELKSKNKVEINKIDTTLSSYQTSLFNITKINRKIHVQTNFGFNLIWQSDLAGSFELQIHDKIKTCGLLGDNNNKKEDDLRMRNGTILYYKNEKKINQNLINKMGDSWMINTIHQPLRCQLFPTNSLQSLSECSFHLKSVQQSCENMLQIIFKKLKGPNVSKCFNNKLYKDYNAIDATRIYDDCVTEICSCQKKQEDCHPNVAIQELEKVCLENDVIFPDIEWKE